MQIGGFQKISLIDYPGKIAAVIFTQGCNFRCPYCHNPELVLPSYFQQTIDEDEVIDFLLKRKGMLQGVVISGGEPTVQKDLIPFLGKIRNMGYDIKLDTNGSHPEVLRKCIDGHMVNYIAMDIKAPLKRYADLAGVKVNTDHIQESIQMIIHSDVEHCFRTTILRSLLSEDDLLEISMLVKKAKQYQVQNFTYQKTILDPILLDRPTYSEEEFLQLRSKWNWVKEKEIARKI